MTLLGSEKTFLEMVVSGNMIVYYSVLELAIKYQHLVLTCTWYSNYTTYNLMWELATILQAKSASQVRILTLSIVTHAFVYTKTPEWAVNSLSN